VPKVFRKYNISGPTFYEQKKYGLMTAAEVCKLRALKEKDHFLKRLLADQVLEVDALRDVIERSRPACGAKGVGYEVSCFWSLPCFQGISYGESRREWRKRFLCC